jgi:prepilin-type N-terminal cleavage/methylation domain-containing protein
MLDRIKKDNKGFTIIEVLIVLAIAGLIMIIVFLAVPALQRNQRNQSARTEANNILSAAAEISANKNGATLTASASSTAGSDAANILAASNAKVITAVTIEAATGTTAPTATSAVIRLVSKCDQTTNPPSATSGSSRQIALLFLVETSSSTLQQCVSS